MAKQILLFKGNIRKVYANEISLQKDHVVPIAKEEILTDQALFYYYMHKFINLDYGTVLPTEEEALTHMTEVVDSQRGKIIDVLEDDELPEEEKNKFLTALKICSSCLFTLPEELRPSHMVSKKEFKQLKKARLHQDRF